MNQERLPKWTTMDRILNLSGIFAPLVLLAAVVVAGSLHPNYSHISQPVSALGAQGAPYQAILNYGGLVPAGILTLLFSLAVWRNVKTGRLAYIGPVLVALAGLGRYLAGLFPCDPGCLAFWTVSARVHAIAGMTAMLAGAVAPLFVAAGLRSHDSRNWYILSLVCGIGSLTSLAAVMSLLWPQYLGLFQRTTLAFFYGWVFIVAIGIGIKRSPALVRHRPAVPEHQDNT